MTERIRTKSELKRLFTNLKRKEITDDMISILIDVLWRDKTNLRTSGFDKPGGTDAVISFDEGSRTFTILPLDPLVDGWIPRFGIYTWNQRAVYQRMYETYELEIPDEEGLYLFYFSANAETRVQELVFVKNPTTEQLEKIYTEQVIVAAIYWDATAHAALYFGDDRHGSEWNPQIQRYLHEAFSARRRSGLQLTGMVINGDGSQDAHAQFQVTAGEMWHDDILMSIPATGTEIQVLYQAAAGPRFKTTAGFGVYKAGRITYNPTAGEPVDVPDNTLCLYHIFATNEHVTTARKTISVMGTTAYSTMADVYAGVPVELDALKSWMPQSGLCYIDSIIFRCKLTYTNSVKAIIVGIAEQHPPVTINEDSVDFLEISERQVLRWKGAAGVADHGALTGLADDDHSQYHNDARGDARYYTKTQLNTSGAGGAVHWNNVTNKPTYDNYYAWGCRAYSAAYGNALDMIGSNQIVVFDESTTIDVQRIYSGSGATLKFHHKDTSTQASVTNTGETVIQSITLDTYGHVTALASKTVSPGVTDHGALTGLADDDHSQYHNDTRGDARYYTKTQLNTSGGGGAVHWNNVTNKPTYDNYQSWHCKAYSVAYGNRDDLIASNYKVLFEESTTIDVQQTFSGDTANLKFHHKDTSTQASVTNTGETVIQSITLDTYGHVTALASKTVSPGVTDHGALSGLADNDHPQYAFINGAYENYFQVSDLRFGSAAGWKFVMNGTTLELRYNGTLKFEFKSTGEAYGTNFIVY